MCGHRGRWVAIASRGAELLLESLLSRHPHLRDVLVWLSVPGVLHRATNMSDLVMTATWCEIAATSLVLCSRSLSRYRFWGRGGALALPAPSLSGRCHCSGDGFCAEPAINAAQSLGGFPCASILANTVYGSVFLPVDRNVRSSFIHA